LTDAGIHVFRDEEELPVGEPIKPALIEAIKQSKVLIPIICRDYASSISCLMELVQILECKQTMSRETIPIFYEIEPLDVKDQINSFEKSFLEHEMKGVDSETTKKWKLALKEIGSIKGFETAKIHNGYHSKLIDGLIPIVLRKLKKGRLAVTNYLVGVDHHVQEIMRMLGIVHRNGQVIEICGSDVRVLGIYGIGGLDLSLQNQLISDLRKRSVAFGSSDTARTALAEGFRDKQVFILLDGVDDVKQLNLVVEKHSWFGLGSRIIVTSRNSDILLRFKGAKTYEVEAMEEEKALQLFSKQAFPPDSPDKGFPPLSRNIIEALGRLPFALEVTGSFLFKKSKGIWEETLGKLKKAPGREVEQVLKISYDALEEEAKQIFLDLACFLIGKDRRIAFYMWDACDFVLLLGSTLFVSCLWSAVADDWEGWTQMMEKANKLKVLDLTGCSQLCKTPCFPADCKLERLILEQCSHLSLIDKSIGNLEHLKSLNIKSTPIVLLPEEMGSLKNLEELLIDKTSIRHLHFLRGSMQQLKTLSASSCKKLADLSESIGCLVSLSHLALDEAIIRELPNSVNSLEGLVKLSLRDCRWITALPDSIGMLKSLQMMDLSKTRIKILPESIKNLDRVEVLRMENTHISKFPNDITNLGKLQVITFSDCRSLHGNFLCDISGLSSLRILELSFTLIGSLPESICQLSHLQILYLLDCDELQTLPRLPSSLLWLDIKFIQPRNPKALCLPNVTSLPEDFNALTRLKKLDLSCINLLDLPQLPSSLSKLLLKNCQIQGMNFSNLEFLSELELRNCDASEIIGLGNLRLLQVLKISGCNMKNLDGLEQASQLRRFSLSECHSLERLPDLSNC
ncbi:hypothetical protein EUGRSUZ_E03335, partial [Eucalyptus grandis]